MKPNVVQWLNTNVFPCTSNEELRDGIHLAYSISQLLYQGAKDVEIKIRTLRSTDIQSCILNLQYCLQILKQTPLATLGSSLDAQQLYQTPLKIATLIQSIYDLSGKSGSQEVGVPLPRKPPKPVQKQQQQDLFYVEENSMTMPSQDEPILDVAQQYRVLKPQNPYQNSQNSQLSQQSQLSQNLYQNSQMKSNSSQSNDNIDHRNKFVEPQSSVSSTSLVTPTNEQQAQTYFNSQTLGIIKEENNSSILGLTPIKQESSMNGSNIKIKQLQKEIQQLEDRIRREGEQSIPNKSHLSNGYNNKSEIDKENKGPFNHSGYNQSSFKQEQIKKCQQVDLDERMSVILWLQEIRLIKKSAKNLEEKLPNICQDGVIFFDLLNRLSGKEGVIRGAIRHPKTPTQISHNYRRIMAYLQTFERFNPRTLSMDHSNDSNAFWTLLVDIKNIFTLNVNQGVLKKQDNSDIEKNTRKNSSILSDNDKILITVPSPKQQRSINFSPATYTKMYMDGKQSSSNKFDFRTPKQGTPQHSQFMNSPARSSISKQGNSNKQCSSQKMAQKYVTVEMVLYVQNYLKEKYADAHVLEKDPSRNGEFLREIIEMPTNYKRNLSSIENAIQQALQRVQDLVETGAVPLWCGSVQTSDVMQSSRLCLGMYWWLIKHYGQHQEDTHYMSAALPYKLDEIDQLKRKTVQWVRETCPKIQCNQSLLILKVQNFSDLVAKCQTGVLLCEIVGVTCMKIIEPTHKLPQSQQHCITNIVKALSVLRALKIGNKFLWKEKEIYDGDSLIILGLLEDIRRFQDGLPERNGANYFIEGPYLKNQIIDQCFDLPRAPMKQSGSIEPIGQSRYQTSQSLPFQLQFSPKSRIDKPYSLINKVNRSLNFENNPDLPKQSKQLTIPDVAQKIVESVDVQVVKEWLNLQFDGLGDRINWSHDILEEFRDGTLLVMIIQKCEGTKLTGVVQCPKTAAACTANVRKAFAILKGHKQMTTELLFDADKTLVGTREYIIKLLQCIKSIYRNQNTYKSRSIKK